MLTCKSFARIVRSGERPIETSSSWFHSKFLLGKLKVFKKNIVTPDKANDQELRDRDDLYSFSNSKSERYSSRVNTDFEARIKTF